MQDIVQSSEVEKIDVLFVDDSETLCNAMELWFQYNGYGVRTASSPRDAKAIIAACTPSVIFIDLILQTESGYELFLSLKKEASLECTRFIALTGRKEDSDREKALSLGFDFFVSKPPNFDELSRLLAECFGREPDNL